MAAVANPTTATSPAGFSYTVVYPRVYPIPTPTAAQQVQFSSWLASYTNRTAVTVQVGILDQFNLVFPALDPFYHDLYESLRQRAAILNALGIAGAGTALPGTSTGTNPPPAPPAATAVYGGSTALGGSIAAAPSVTVAPPTQAVLILAPPPPTTVPNPPGVVTGTNPTLAAPPPPLPASVAPPVPSRPVLATQIAGTLTAQPWLVPAALVLLVLFLRGRR